MTTKTELSKAGLQKGLAALAAAAQGPDVARATELFSKNLDGSITADEKDELMKSIEGGLPARTTAGLTGSEAIAKSVNVSDYLREHHAGVVQGLSVLADHMVKSGAEEHKFRVALATTLHHQGELLKAQIARADAAEELLKSVTERLGIIAAQPARGPKSVAGPTAAAAAGVDPMNKSMGGAPGAGEGMTKRDVLVTMNAMLEKGGIKEVAGESLVHAATKYESLNEITEGMLQAVKHFRKHGKAA